jgi:hypothetical protein
MISRIKIWPSLLMAFMLILASCKERSDIEKVIESAGENGKELKKALNHFNHPDDSLKLKAAHFLIVNMLGKGSFDYYLTDSLSKRYDIDLFDYEVYDSIKKAKSEIEKKIGRRLSYARGEFIADIRIIKADYLIDHIDRTFIAWNMPWAKHLSFSEFCEALLPYRIGNEPLPIVSKIALNQIEKFKSLSNTIDDPLTICSIINDSLKNVYAWRHNETIGYPGLLSLAQIDKIKGGRCEDLNTLTAISMRMAGVPVFSESTLYLGNRDSGGHSWLSVLDKEHNAIPFNSIYDNPVKGKLPFGDSRIAKSYRKYYAAKKLAQNKSASQMPMIYLDDPSLDDNTSCLVEVFSHNVPRESLKENINQSYLGILNGDNWKVIAKGEVSENNLVFKNLGKDVIYLPVKIDSAKLKTIGSPFIYQSIADSLIILAGNSTEISSIKISIKKYYWWLRKDREYQLYFWKDDKWQKLYEPILFKDNLWLSKSTEGISSTKNELIIAVSEKIVYRFVDNLDIKDWGSWSRPFVIIDSNFYQY